MGCVFVHRCWRIEIYAVSRAVPPKGALCAFSKIIYTIVRHHKRMKKDAVAYLNTRKKEDLAAQMAEVDDFCKYRFRVVEIFHDHRAYATPPEKRKGFSGMLEYCAANNCRDIIIYDLAGLAKDPDAGLAALKSLNEQYTVYCVHNDFFGFMDEPEQRRAAIADFIEYMEHYRENARKIVPAASKKAKKDRERSIGRPKALTEGQVQALITLREAGTSISQICRMFDVSRSTVSKVLADYPELKGEWKGTRQEPGDGQA